MMRRSVLFALPALALAVLLLLPDTSFAQRWGRGRYGGYYGGYGNYGWDGGYRYGGYGWDGGGYGRPYYGYGGYGGYGGYAGYGGRLGLFGRRSMDYGYAGGYYGSPYFVAPYDARVTTGPVSDDTMISQAFYPSTQQTDANLGRILVRVPPEAEVLFDGTATQQKGVDRMFETPPLQPNKTYTYEVTARFRDRDGQERTEKRTVSPMPGRIVTVNFLQPQSGQIQSPQDTKKRPDIRNEDR